MKRKYCQAVFLCLALFLLTIGCSSGGKENAASKEPARPMTLMIYMVGSDLEAATAAATNDMKEIEASGVDLSKVKLLVYTGGSPKWHNDTVEVPTDSHAVFELTENGFSKVSDFEALSMGESTSLTRFLQYGYENYKSETYGLILWDHGNGPVMGYGSDILYDKDALTLPEIETALEDSPFGEEQKFSFIGFDACLMASAELTCIVDDYAEYLIASQEVEPGFGWNYQFLEKCGKVNTLALVQEIVDTYIAYCESYFEQNEFFKSEVTLAAVDLSYAKELETSIDNLFGAAAEDVSGSFNQLALDRIETRAFGRATTGSEYDLVDIQALMSSMNSSYEEETKAVQDVLEKMVICSGSNTVESCGLSLYYPYYNKTYYESSWKASYSELGLFPNYIDYLDRYGQIWLGTDMKEYFSGKLVAEDGGSGIYTLQLNEAQAEHYADSGFYILRRMGEDAYSAVYYSQNVTNDNGLLTADFDGKVLYYGDELGFKSIPMTRALDEVDGEIRYALFPVLTGSVDEFLNAESLACRIVLSVDEESGEVTVLDFSESSDEEIQTGKRPQIDLEEWVRIQFFEIRGRYLTRDDDGRILQYWDWPEGDWILWNELALADGLQFTYEPLYDDGNEYFLMFDVMDVQGNRYSSELYPVTLEEKPPQEAIKPTDAGVIEESTGLIFDREGVKMYLDLLKDESIGQTAYCLRVENTNDFSVRIYMDDVMINDTISCTDTSPYVTVDANSTNYGFMTEVSTTCTMEQIKIPKQLSFSVKMNNEVNDKTLINEEVFAVHFSESAHPEITFIDFMGAHAEEQMLLDQENGIHAALLGAGYHLTRSNYLPDDAIAELTGIIRVENTSDAAQTVRLEGVEINDILITAQEYEANYVDAVSLEAGQIFYYEWTIARSTLESYGVTEIASMANVLSVESANETISETLNIKLAEE